MGYNQTKRRSYMSGLVQSRNSATLDYLKGLAREIHGAKRVNLRDDIRRAKNIAAVYDREMMKNDDIFDIEDKLNDLRPNQPEK